MSGSVYLGQSIIGNVLTGETLLTQQLVAQNITTERLTGPSGTLQILGDISVSGSIQAGGGNVGGPPVDPAQLLPTGGTTGQLIRKVSPGQYDVEWATVPRPSDTRLYVSLQGNDLNNGKGWDTAFRTLKKALEVATLHTVYVESGTFVEQNPLYLNPGTAIVGDNLRRTIITPANPRADMFFVNNGCYMAGLRIINLQRPAFGVSFARGIAESTVQNGAVTGVVVYYSPSGYTSPPTVFIPPPESGNGVQATAIAFVTDGVVTSVQITSGGSGYEVSERPHVTIPPPENIKVSVVASPYIQNCSSITGPYDTEGVLISVQTPLPYDIDNVEGTGRRVDRTGAGGGLLVDGLLTKANSPLRSMVCDAYTQVNQGGPGFFAINLGYTQLVSCFSTFCSYGVKAAWGGSINLSNSVSDFGDLALVSVGQWTIPYTQGTVTQTYTSSIASIELTTGGGGSGYASVPTVRLIGGGGGYGAEAFATIDSSIAALVVQNGGSGYTLTPTVVITGPNTTPAVATAIVQNGVIVGIDIKDGGGGYNRDLLTIEIQGGGGSGAIINAQVGKVTKITILNAGAGYTSIPSIEIDAPTYGTNTATAEAILSGNGTFVMNNFSIVNTLIRRPDVGSVVRIAESWYTVANVAQQSPTDATVFVVSLYPAVNAVASGTAVNFYTVSSVSTGNHVCEYVGSGCTYNSLPEYGGVPIPGNQVTQRAPGRVYYATTNNIGDMSFGPYFRIEQSTGTVTLDATSFDLSGLNAIGPFKRNGVRVGNTLREVSDNINLESVDQDTTVPTQSAVVGYVAPRSVPLGGNRYQVLSKYSDQSGEIQWANVGGNASALFSLNASNVSTGTLSTLRLPSDITVSGTISAAAHTGNGFSLSLLNAANVAGIIGPSVTSINVGSGTITAGQFNGTFAGTIASGSLAIANVTGLQAALDSKLGQSVDGTLTATAFATNQNPIFRIGTSTANNQGGWSTYAHMVGKGMVTNPGATLASSNGLLTLSDTVLSSASGIAFDGSSLRLMTYANNTQTGNVAVTPNTYTRVFVNSSGQVGINTTSPQSTLDVNGILSMRGGEIRLRSATDSANFIRAPVSQSPFGVSLNGVNMCGSRGGMLSTEFGWAMRWAADTVGGSTSFNIYVADQAFKTTSTWDMVCDRRVKTDIQNANVDTCWDTVKQLPLQRYTYTTEYADAAKLSDRSVLGWVADDVQRVFPKAVVEVSREDLGYTDLKTLDHDQMYKCMWGALGKAIEKIDDLQTRLAALESRN